MIWGSGIYYGQYIEENYQSVSVRMKGVTVAKQVLLRALENEEKKGTADIPSITAWNRSEKQTLKNEELATKASARIIEVYGDMKQVYPMTLTEGTLPYSEDYEGCVIDENSAYELFRTSSATGNFITYQNKKYCIRGVIKAEEPMMLIHIYQGNNTYSNLELEYEDKENGGQLAENFISQNSLADTASYTLIEGSFYARTLKLFYRIPAWFLGFYMLYRLMKCIWKRRTLPLQVVILLLVFMSVWLVLQWLMEFQFYIPERLIPTRWSNFTFWIEKFTAFRNQLKQITYLTPVPKDVILINCVRRCICYVSVTFTCMVVFVMHRKIVIKKNDGAIMGVRTVLVEAAAIFLLYKTGKVFHLSRGYIGMLPLFIISTDITDKVRELLLNVRKQNSLYCREEEKKDTII